MRVPGIPFVQGRNRYRDGDARKYGIAIHNTSNNASDTAEASYATRRPDGVSSHFYVDGDSITQSIDTYDRAGHAGSTHGNDHGISVEITGANGWSRDQWLRGVAWDKLGRVLAAVIRYHWPDGSFQVRHASVAEMRANPKVKALYGHNDMRQAWGSTTHTDPGPHFPWDRLTSAINAALGKPPTPTPTPPKPPEEGTDMFPDTVTVPDPKNPGKTTTRTADQWAAEVWSRTNADVNEERFLARKERAAILAAVTAVKAGQAAILGAINDDDGAAILARINEVAAEIRAEAEAEAVRDAELRDMVERFGRGELAAEEVVRLIGERLAVAGDTPDEQTAGAAQGKGS
jgi:hypothetical protein